MSTEVKHVQLESLEEGVEKHDTLVQNPTYMYFQHSEKLHGFLSQQFPTIANPAPLGLCGFALTTFVLSMYNTGAIINLRASSHGVVMGLAMFYGGLVQLLAGMWEFKTGNTFGAVLFSSYGGFWMSFAALSVKAFGFLDDYTSNNDLRNSLGIYLLAWAFFSLLMTLCVHRTTLALMTLLFLVFMTFLMLSIGEFTHTSPGNIYCTRAGGIFGILAAALAWYCAVAALLTNKNSFITLPVGELDPIYRRLGWLNDDKVQ
eukprot:gene9316-10284_t